jgi:acyl-CoA reductase-like NAD-dependent aldehyde dehydrogenase
MATAEKAPAAARTNGRSSNGSNGIAVENPATGQIIATVPSLRAADVKAMVARARAAQPAWEALGFEERARIFRRMQKWTVDNADRIIETIVSETGKTYEDAQLAEVM